MGSLMAAQARGENSLKCFYMNSQNRRKLMAAHLGARDGQLGVDGGVQALRLVGQRHCRLAALPAPLQGLHTMR